MQIREKVGIKGVIEITITDMQTGKKTVQKLNNLVVNTGLDALVNLIRGAGTGDNEITHLNYGTDFTAPTATDTGLTGTFVKVIDGTSFVSTGNCKIIGSLDTTENNGMTIQEIGLFQANGDLFARANIAPIVKTNLITVQVTWNIIITV